MNGFDIVIIIVISFGFVRGFFRGFIKEVASIAGVIAGFYGAYTYYRPVAEYLSLLADGWGMAGNWETYGNIASFFILFLGIAGVIAMIASIIRFLLRIVFLGWVDKLFGVVFGAAKGVLVVSVVFTVLTGLMPAGQPDFVAKSSLAPYVVHISEIGTVFISSELKGDLKNRIERMKEIWKQQKTKIQNQITEQVKDSVQESMSEKMKQKVGEKTVEKNATPVNGDLLQKKD